MSLSPRNAPAWRDALALGVFARWHHERAGGAAVSQVLAGFRSAELFYGSSDFVATVGALSPDAPTLPPPPTLPRGATPSRVLVIGGDLRDESGDLIVAATLGAGYSSSGARAGLWPMWMAVTQDRETTETKAAAYDDASPTFALLTLAFWVLDNPDLVDHEVVDVAPSRPSKAARRRGAVHEPSPVTVVDLRAPVRKARAEVAAAERTYRHRWIVRGHWHRYKVGRGRQLEEVRYVMPYVKGPADAPLNATELVRRW